MVWFFNRSVREKESGSAYAILCATSIREIKTRFFVPRLAILKALASTYLWESKQDGFYRDRSMSWEEMTSPTILLRSSSTKRRSEWDHLDEKWKNTKSVGILSSVVDGLNTCSYCLYPYPFLPRMRRKLRTIRKALNFAHILKTPSALLSASQRFAMEMETLANFTSHNYHQHGVGF